MIKIEWPKSLENGKQNFVKYYDGKLTARQNTIDLK
jgi:hypothetical protein